MNFQNILTEIEKVDPEVYGRFDSRRGAMKRFTGLAGKLTLAAIPMAVASMFNKAYGQTPADVNGVLNFALTLEYLEAEFYNTIVGSAGYLTGTTAAQAALTKIKADENNHVAFLKTVLSTNAIAKPNIDLTGGGSAAGTGPFAGFQANYAVQLAMAQTFEDTGVRAYKGQAANLQSNKTVLTAALNIHSVEARHASHIRYMRRGLAQAVPAGQTLKPWITLNQTGIDFAPANTAIQASYNGEEVTSQAGVSIVNLGGTYNTAEAASQGFDEPLTKAQVSSIVSIFFYP